MNPETSRQAFARQTQRFQELFERALKHYGKPLGRTLAPPKAVLSFAEDLMLCPTEDGALIRIERNLEAARGCYVTARDVASEAYLGRALILIPTSSNETPFCLLGAIVRLRAEAAIQQHGDSWY